MGTGFSVMTGNAASRGETDVLGIGIANPRDAGIVHQVLSLNVAAYYKM